MQSTSSSGTGRAAPGLTESLGRGLSLAPLVGEVSASFVPSPPPRARRIMLVTMSVARLCRLDRPAYVDLEPTSFLAKQAMLLRVP